MDSSVGRRASFTPGLNRGGDRAANSALHMIVLCRMGHDPRTQDYVDRRTKQGLGKKEIMRCLKRHVVREVHEALIADFKILNSGWIIPRSGAR